MIKRFFWTLFLFTFTDFKTIVFPVTFFACVAAPVGSAKGFIYAVFWTWLHLLQVNVSNQYKSLAEDALNHPWRPIPSGRISQNNATYLRWLLVPLCTFTSIPYGWRVICATFILTTALIVYDEYGLSGHWIGKNVINAIGYASFELGATTIMGDRSQLDEIALKSLLCSVSLVLTTIHAQDFSDAEGDSALGRSTFPIYAPNISRIYTLLALIIWSYVLGQLWNLGIYSRFSLGTLGLLVGWRFYRLRSAWDDKNTFICYNLWLLFVHLLPAHHRWAIFRY
ncbi:UbiA prenyltransferase family [Collybia nuda]|uniref:UbiA prenyltransferase family n=1 Tax=Collybia nuda TaxID=64659 RepID=A0A9P5XZR3_9AGAR|nr:UbiA prenyltransferase family [Collybia nuda]